MNKLVIKAKSNDSKLVKKVAADKAKLPSRRDGGAKTEAVKTVGLGCVPLGTR